jgi:UDP-4-amino-4,6-dideoxy-N-acetyl-beta-L-altrosamine transaminase
VAVNSATSALHIACLALDLGPGDWLWTSPNTFVASANCGLYCGAKVDFVDIDPRTYNMSVDALAEKLECARRANKLPKIVIPVHFAGQSCEMREIRKLADEYNFRIIEDASHAIGGSYLGELIGNCRHSDITIFSFHPVKIVTTAEGGMALTNDADLAMTMALLRSHGITRDDTLMTQDPHGPWYYEQVGLGFNYRMTDIQAALGISQMQRLDAFISKRRELVARYNEQLQELSLKLPMQIVNATSAWHLYVIRLDLQKLSKSHCQIFSALRDAGIGVNLHYIPVHLQPYYQKLGFCLGDFPEAEKYYMEVISLPMFPALTVDQQDYVITALKDNLV